MNHQPRPRLRRIGASLAAAIATTALVGSAAGAAPGPGDYPPAGSSKAMANGFGIRLLGGDVLMPNVEAVNDGSVVPYAANTTNPTLPPMPVQLTAGVIGARTQAYPNPSDAHPAAHPSNWLVSAACGGLVSQNGLVQIGADGNCTSTDNTNDGVVVDLAALKVKAGAIYSSCTVDDQGYWTGTSSLANAGIYTPGALGLPDVKVLDLTANPAPNTGLTVPLLANVMLNQVRIVGGSLDGQPISSNSAPLPADAVGINVKALDVSLLGESTGLSVGETTCFKQHATPLDEIPVVPSRGLPIAAATAIGLLGLGYVGLRRRIAA